MDWFVRNTLKVFDEMRNHSKTTVLVLTFDASTLEQVKNLEDEIEIIFTFCRQSE